MAIGIYKPGQGYWVRVLTASLMGVCVLAVAAWVWQQAGAAAEQLPKSIWTIPLKGTHGTAAAGETVRLVGKATGDQPAPLVATAQVVEFIVGLEGSSTLRIKGVSGAAVDADPTRAARVEGGPAGTGAFGADVSGLVTSASPVEAVTVQGIAMGVILILGALLIYWLIGMKPQTVDFLIATDTEMKKVNWSKKEDIKRSTLVVIGACFLLTIVLFTFDQVLAMFFRAIGVLTSGSAGS